MTKLIPVNFSDLHYIKSPVIITKTGPPMFIKETRTFINLKLVCTISRKGYDMCKLNKTTNRYFIPDLFQFQIGGPFRL